VIEERVESIGPALDETPVAIGKALMSDFLLPFEVASILLLAALIGATIVARRGGVEGV
jgi:NADH-quinone oxidoreductase subunit J